MQIRDPQKMQKIFRIVSHAMTAIFLLAYLAMACLAYGISVRELHKLLLFSLIPFLLVSLLRVLIASPRPATAGKHKGEKNSFPSRHAFSGFFIAMLAFFYKTYLSYLLLGAAILLAAARVLSGEHYPKDVVAGAGIGVISGTVVLILL